MPTDYQGHTSAVPDDTASFQMQQLADYADTEKTIVVGPEPATVERPMPF